MKCSRCIDYDICCTFDYVSAPQQPRRRTGKRIEEARQRLGTSHSASPEAESVPASFKHTRASSFPEFRSLPRFVSEHPLASQIRIDPLDNPELRKHLQELYFSTAHLQRTVLESAPTSLAIEAVMIAWAVRWSTHPLIIGDSDVNHITRLTVSQKEKRRIFVRDAWIKAKDALNDSGVLFTATIENLQALLLFCKIPIPDGHESEWSKEVAQDVATKHAFTLGLNMKQTGSDALLTPSVLNPHQQGSGTDLLWWTTWCYNAFNAARYTLPVLAEEDTDFLLPTYVPPAGPAGNPSRALVNMQPAELNMTYLSATVAVCKICRDMYLKVLSPRARFAGRIPTEGAIQIWADLQDWSSQYAVVFWLWQGLVTSMTVAAKIKFATTNILYNASYLIQHRALQDMLKKQTDSDGDVKVLQDLLTTSQQLSLHASMRIANLVRDQLLNLPSEADRRMPFGQQAATAVPHGSILRLDCNMISEFIFDAGSVLLDACKEAFDKRSDVVQPKLSAKVATEEAAFDILTLTEAVGWCLEALQDMGDVWEHTEAWAAQLKTRFDGMLGGQQVVFESTTLASHNRGESMSSTTSGPQTPAEAADVPAEVISLFENQEPTADLQWLLDAAAMQANAAVSEIKINVDDFSMPADFAVPPTPSRWVEALGLNDGELPPLFSKQRRGSWYSFPAMSPKAQ